MTKMKFGYFLLSLLAAGSALAPVQAAETALVNGDGVNVRGQPSMTGEVITHLKKGDSVILLEFIPSSRQATNGPAPWARIQMPAHTPVWLKASLLGTHNTVIPYRANLRAGPGVDHSMVGQLQLGQMVKPIRSVKGWAEIAGGTNAYAFVAARFLTIEKPVPVPEKPAVEAKPPASKPPESVVASAPVPSEPKPEPPVVPAAQILTPPPVGIPVPIVEEPPPRRIVVREGRAERVKSIQAPTYAELRSTETGKLLDYLQPMYTNMTLKPLYGTRIVVTGEEYMDVRWRSTPVIKIQILEIAP